ncbi:MAG: hypothetical protein MJH10_10900 [Epibacterium sp.]|nr:hypothetical protein [Epibacterium sp.]
MQGAKHVEAWLLDDVPSLKKLQINYPFAFPRNFTVTVCRKGRCSSDTFHLLSEAMEFLKKTEHKIDFFSVCDDAKECKPLALRAGYWVRLLPDGELTDLGDCVKDAALSILDQLDIVERFNWTDDKIEFQLFQKTGECSL